MAWDKELGIYNAFGGNGVVDQWKAQDWYRKNTILDSNKFEMSLPSGNPFSFTNPATWNSQDPTTGRLLSPSQINAQAIAYPIDIDIEQDHVEIDEFQYRRPGSGAGGEGIMSGAMQHQDAAGPGASTSAEHAYGGTIILPMPKVSDANAAEWGKSELSFDELNRSNRASVRRGAGFGQRGRDDQQMRDAEQAGQTGRRGTGPRNRGERANQTNYLLSRELGLNAKRVQESIGGNVTASSFLARARGQILNPNAELLFQGPVLREFQFTWLLVARSQREGTSIRKIIKKFKQGAAPKWNNTALLESPSIWEIQYKSGDNLLNTANRFGQTALTSITVDYAPEGYWSAYDDSHPVAVRMNLNFKEIRAIYQTDQMETPDDSVGY